jgi:lysozyme family protein
MALPGPAIDVVMANEGGYVYHSSDPGGETNHGISKRSYPHLDIRALTKADARAIYLADFWEAPGLWRIQDQGIANKVMDLCVVMGPTWGVICLQRALRSCGHILTQDGILGPVTASETNAADAYQVLPALRSEAAGRFRRIVGGNPKQFVFLEGWLNRAYQ